MTLVELHEKYLNKHDKIFPFDVIGQLNGCAKRSRFIHKECGYEWETTAHKILNGGRGCARCSGVEKYKSTEDWVAGYKRKTGKNFPYIFLEPYTNARANTLVRHESCGHEWRVKPYNLMSGKTCPKCAGNIRNSKEGWYRAFEKKYSKRCEYIMTGDYTCNKTQTEFHHEECGHTWQARPANIMNGRGCPRCALYGFRHQRESTLYYLKAFDKDNGNPIYKIGITNFDVKSRFRKESEGIEFHEWKMDGSAAMDAEKQILEKHEKHRIKNNYFGYANGSTEWFDIDVLGLFP